VDGILRFSDNVALFELIPDSLMVLLYLFLIMICLSSSLMLSCLNVLIAHLAACSRIDPKELLKPP
jgi:hypothetical protein